MEGEYVALEKCLLCREDIGILLDKRLRKTFKEKYVSTPTSVCDKCKNTYLKEGIMFINPNTGSLAVIKESAVDKFLSGETLERAKNTRIIFCEEEVIQKLSGK